MTAPLAIGIDVGGTQVRVALVEQGRLLRRAAMATDVAGGPAAVMQQICALAREVCGPQDQERVATVGVAAPGPLDSDTGIVLHIPTLPGWEDFPLRSALAAALGRPVTMENDGIAAAYGEWKFGAGQGLRHLVYVTISTGIGGGIVVDGRLMRGHRGMAGHVGHLRMSNEGPQCSCGAQGCFEASASGSAFDKKARATALANPDSWLGRTQGPIGTGDIAQGARAGDRLCMDLIKAHASLLGTGFASLIHLYSPQCIIMGGGVSKAFDLLEPGIHQAIAREAMQAFRNVTVIQAKLGDNSGLIGVAALAVEAL